MRKLDGTTLALLGALLLLVLAVAYLATRGNADQDKLTNSQITALPEASSEKLCASKATYDLIKRELFRRAAQLRGSDQAAYDKLSAFAALRMDNPVMESEDSAAHAVNCSGSLSLDLPPGVAVAGGRRSLTSDVDYSLRPAADGSGTVVLLRNADAIIAPLATLARVAEPAPAPDATLNEVAPAEPRPPIPGTPPSAIPSPPSAVVARPSFDCASARTRGEVEVCGDPGLAALDRTLAAQYARALASASPEQSDLLRQTRDRFLRYRDRCPDRQCMGDAYVSRMREIRDIVEGRWQPPR